MSILDLFSLKGKVVLITGATNGIGKAMAQALYEAGASVILTHRPATDPASTVQFLRDSYPGSEAKIGTIEVDLGEVKIENLEAEIVRPALELSPTGEIDILINNAGITNRETIVDASIEEYHKVLHVNLHVPSELSKLVARRMIRQKIRGKILFTASLTSFRAASNLSAYTTSKGAIVQFAKCCAVEWAQYGINVNCIGPGYVRTNMTTFHTSDEARETRILSKIPKGRWGTPEDFKGPVVFLCSAASDYVDGECLMVDGGFLALM
ncbi:hypothetical protein KL918_004777 [Ogataea parapolymorpha]|uniref:Peroxisomal 2,4-dienoyl-CoA reductase, auxiliary enzyme of fatty acid beta-oxidation n=1 Tax=Ogataea parapolymorpha (strain ATCC 26012 / BCRC 20466 / JCM 22074 / NRRL Y-7560 / DL-1) TaxID=871575 RepID=W1QKY5_OGAPD|nr:Peroxisomal 2,4-dienoyl-CoA reductase, auxiliary enzyme of fatty acid beta-oxidation [Ogataea parapolymorpha DL-1]ESX01806.1 Peroxisomal 2,4-dienoyl-CoA reductase, auxiliary enzyme of fatty acid beta-oxidation [Ogataea parapolymorpha DL-1]KAG7865195.1 hypothetical protein KL918_004777 [Ogataea parapolymorpha]KAG7872780.1 hypothetical protein KL916_002825 [Ogataea parapolymorpha]